MSDYGSIISKPPLYMEFRRVVRKCQRCGEQITLTVSRTQKWCRECAAEIRAERLAKTDAGRRR